MNKSDIIFTTGTPDVKFVTKNSSSFTKLVVLAQSFQAASGKATAAGKGSANRAFNSPLAAIGREFLVATEDAVRQAVLGHRKGGPIQPGKGGFSPDFFYVDESGQERQEEIKSIIARGEIDATGQLSIIQAREIGLGGGSGVTLRRPQPGQTSRVTTGFKGGVDEEGKPLGRAVETDVDISSFFNLLEKAAGLKGVAQQKLIVDRLRNPGSDEAAKYYRKTLETKANAINIPIVIGDKVFNRKLRFTFEDLATSALSGQGGRFSVKKEGTNSIKFNFKFSRAQIERLLAYMSNGSLQQIDLNMDKVLEDLLKFSKGIITNSNGIRAFLKGLDLSVALEYLQGSALMFQGGVTRRKKPGLSQSTQQKFISATQLTALLQRRLAQIMPRGPQKGPPLSPNILTERTGRFRRSVQAIPSYRNNLIRFFYDPIYKTFIDSPRNPDVFITTAIREIVRANFSRNFGIIRGA